MNKWFQLTFTPFSKACDPEEFLLLFINRNQKLVVFLEHVLAVFLFTWSNSFHRCQMIWICFQAHPDSPHSLRFALLEQYLLSWSKRITDAELEGKIMHILKHHSILSAADRALFLCQTHKFRPGSLFIFEKTKLYNEILQFYAGEGDFDNVLITCRRYYSFLP